MVAQDLTAIVLALAERRSLPDVLRLIAEKVAGQSGVALARVWLREPGDDTGLYLRASAGRSLTGADWGRIDGSFRRVDLTKTTLKIAHMALTGESIRIPDLRLDNTWVRHPEWAQAEELVSFSGHALVFRGEILGVLAVFRRVPSGDDCFAWLGTMANAAAIAIANARAFEENEKLRRQLEQERDYLMEEVEATGWFGDILGKSPALRRVLHQVEMVAPTGANTLILGESGTGKELVARAIHQRSPRAKKPLVKVNCGSIPRELFESEFFGHVRGSFTGAVRDRVGRFQLADGGTLFLDEVGEIPLELQTKLLRVLQEGEFEAVGDDRTRRVNVRVIAATNRDPRKEIDAGRFRLDLYYRLAVFPIELPPLRERCEDIPDLLAHFVRLTAAKFHMQAPAVPQREMERARAYAWPGNVRQLQNAVERAVILSSANARLTLDLPVEAKTVAPPSAGKQHAAAGEVISEDRWRAMEKANIEAALAQCGGKISGSHGAANLLGLKPGTLASRMKVLGVKRRSAG